MSYNPIEENADIYTKMTIEENADIFTKKNLRTRANDVRNRGEHIAGWGFDPSWEKGSLQMASLVFDATKPLECPLELLWNCDGIVMELSWNCNGIVMSVHWNCDDYTNMFTC